MTDLIISNETQAVDLLERLLNGKELEKDADIKFQGWPVFNIRIKGKDFDGSIPTRIMPTLLDLQAEVNKLYCVSRYGDPDTRKLTKKDREQLELIIKVDKGSSIYETFLQDPFYKILQDAVQRMPPEYLLIIVISFGILATGSFAWKNWLKAQSEKNELNYQIEMSKTEKEKIEIIANATTLAPEIKSLTQGINELRRDMVSKLKDKDNLQLIPEKSDKESTDFNITGSQAQEVTQTPRQTAVEAVETGRYLVLSANFNRKDGTRLEVKRELDDVIFKADVPQNVLGKEQENILRDKGWAKYPMELQLLIRTVGKRITSAKLISVNDNKDNT